jgi:hypothetical protein
MTAGRCNTGPSAPMRGPATRFQRQPFAPFQNYFQPQDPVTGEAPSASRLNLELAGLRFC